MPEPTVVYITYEGVVRSSVFQSQVVEPFCEISERRRAVLCVFERADLLLRYWRRIRDVLRDVRERSGSRVVVLPRGTGWLGLLIARPFLFVATARHASGDVQFHARGYKAALVAVGVKRMFRRSRLVVDVRGLEPEEASYVRASRASGSGRMNPSRELAWERQALGAADAILAVSVSLAEHLVGEHGVASDILVVCPCGAGDEFHFDATMRQSKRAELGLSNRRVALYLGSALQWQMTEWIVALFDLMAECWPGFMGLMVVTDPAALPAAEVSAIRARDHIHLISVDASQVPSILAAADCGVLLREESIINRVASPVKVAESLCVGLPMVVTDTVDQAVEYVDSAKAGVVLPIRAVRHMCDSTSAAEEVKLILRALRVFDPDERQSVSEAFARRLHWTTLGDKIIHAYEISWRDTTDVKTDPRARRAISRMAP